MMIDAATTVLPVVLAAFLASTVEVVEAFTIVLAVALTQGWRPALAGGLLALVVLAVIVAAAYMALTIVGALILSSSRRTRDMAYLRTLGISSVQSVALTVMEHAPPVLLALVPGIALGYAVALLTLPSLGLGTFAGTTGAVPLFVDVPALALMVVALLAVVAVAVVAGTWLSQRARLVNALRMGED